MSMEDLQHQLQAIIDDFPAKTALYCVDLYTGKPLAAIGEDTKVVSASTIKVAILFAALEGVRNGEFDLAQFVSILPEDYCGDTEVFETPQSKLGTSLWEMLYWMIVNSDNTATNAVISLIGFDRVNRFCDDLGLANTSLQRKMLDFKAVAWGRNNYTSPKDQYILYQKLFSGEILTPDLRDIAFDFLGRCRSFDSLQRYLPEPVPVFHKPGGLDHLNHDAGIFLLKQRPYYLGIFTWDGPALDGQPQQKRLIGRLSRVVFDSVSGGMKL